MDRQNDLEQIEGISMLSPASLICIALKLDKETASLEIQRNYCYVVHALFLASETRFSEIYTWSKFLA